MQGSALLAKRTSKSIAAALEGLAVGAGAGADVVLGVDVGGGAELRGELDHVAAADLEVAALVDAAAGRVAPPNPRSDRRSRPTPPVLAPPSDRHCDWRRGTAQYGARRFGASVAAEQAVDHADGFVDDLADRRFGAGDAVDDAFGDAGDAGVAQGAAERGFIDRLTVLLTVSVTCPVGVDAVVLPPPPLAVPDPPPPLPLPPPPELEEPVLPPALWLGAGVPGVCGDPVSPGPPS